MYDLPKFLWKDLTSAKFKQLCPGDDWLFGPEFAEELTKETLEDFIISYLDDSPDVAEGLEICAFQRKKIDTKWLALQAACMVESYGEYFGEEFGPFDDEALHGGSESEMLELLQKWAQRAEVWQHEDKFVLVLTADDLNKIGQEEWPKEWESACS